MILDASVVSKVWLTFFWLALMETDIYHHGHCNEERRFRRSIIASERLLHKDATCYKTISLVKLELYLHDLAPPHKKLIFALSLIHKHCVKCPTVICSFLPHECSLNEIKHLLAKNGPYIPLCINPVYCNRLRKKHFLLL